jgi:hypothetical protein
MKGNRLLNLLGIAAAMALLASIGTVGCVPCALFPQPELEVLFWADQEVLSPGECTALHWEVHGGEDIPVFLNDEEVASFGDEEVCLWDPMVFELRVDGPEGPIVHLVTIEVEGERPPEEPPPGEPPPEEPPPEEPPPEEPPPEGGPEVIILEVNPDMIPQGGCAVLFWEVHPPGEWRVLLGDEEVEPMGEREVCPAATTTYQLLVEAPGGPQDRTVTLRIEAEPEPPPPSTPPPEPTPPPQPTQPGLQPTQPGPQPTTPAPPPPPAPTPTTLFTTDLAITDLYADKLVNGTVYGRFTNRGPGNLTNVVVQVSCQWSKTAYGATLGLMEQMGPRNMTIISLSPNQTTPFGTYITVDLTQWYYDMTCSVQVPFSDPDTGNNSYHEILADPGSSHL